MTGSLGPVEEVKRYSQGKVCGGDLEGSLDGGAGVSCHHGVALPTGRQWLSGSRGESDAQLLHGEERRAVEAGVEGGEGGGADGAGGGDGGAGVARLDGVGGATGP